MRTRFRSGWRASSTMSRPTTMRSWPRPRTTRHGSFGQIQAELTDTSEQEISLLRRMETWAARYENSPDAKAKELTAYLRAVCLPDGKHWTNERVVVFTEYRDTQIWLKELLAQEGMAGEQVQLLFGGMDAEAARAIAAGVPGAAGPEPGAHPARHRRRQRGHRPARALPPAGQLRHPLQPEQAGAAHRPHRPVRPAAQARGAALHRHRLGISQRHIQSGPGVPRADRGQGRPDGGGPRHGQRGPRRRRATADARRDRRLRHRERRRRHETVLPRTGGSPPTRTCPSR